MVLAIDVYYLEENAKAVGVLFDWGDENPKDVIVKTMDNVAGYVPGEFYKRELPILLKIVESAWKTDLEAIIVDGHVFINNEYEYGLGGKLWEKLDHKVPIIGVAKNAFHENADTVKEIIRGKSKKPLYISSIGAELSIAAALVQDMKGNNRIPTILKSLDSMTKT